MRSSISQSPQGRREHRPGAAASKSRRDTRRCARKGAGDRCRIDGYRRARLRTSRVVASEIVSLRKKGQREEGMEEARSKPVRVVRSISEHRTFLQADFNRNAVETRREKRLLSDISRCSLHLVSPDRSYHSSWKREELSASLPRSWKDVGRRESLSIGKPRDSRAGDNERVRAPSSRRGFTRRLGGNALAAFSIGLFRPVSPISHSRAKDDQNDFCAAATATTGVKETGASIARARYTGYYLFAFFGRDYSPNEWPS